MRGNIRGIIFVFAGLALLMIIISLFIPSRVVTVRAVTIHGEKDSIFARINNVQTWKTWNAALAAAPNLVTTDSTATWTSANHTYTLTRKEHTASYTKFLLSRAGQPGVDYFLSVLPVQEPNAFQVEWRAVTPLRWYPWEKFGGIFIEKMSGPGYQDALDRLSAMVEHRPMPGN
jgi:hypothetical protein